MKKIKSPADNRKTLGEQMHGFREEILAQIMEKEIPEPLIDECTSNHRLLAIGQRCQNCGRENF